MFWWWGLNSSDKTLPHGTGYPVDQSERYWVSSRWMSKIYSVHTVSVIQEYLSGK